MSCPVIETGSPPSGSRVYRPRRPAKTLLHQITRENLETYLADLDQGDDFSSRIPLHVEEAFRDYLKCGLLCHGFARAYCAACGWSVNATVTYRIGTATDWSSWIDCQS